MKQLTELCAFLVVVAALIIVSLRHRPDEAPPALQPEDPKATLQKAIDQLQSIAKNPRTVQAPAPAPASTSKESQ